jgi:hypothetical protein
LYSIFNFKISKMKKIFVIVSVLAVTACFSVSAQTAQQKAQNLKRPGDIGVAAYDAFKNSSFNLKDEVAKTDKNYQDIAKEIAKYSTKKKAPTADNIKADIAKVTGIKSSVKTLNDKVVNLAETGIKLTTGLPNVSPVNKIKKATANTQSSLKAIDLSRQMLSGLSSKTGSDLSTLNGLLSKAKGN